MTGRGFELAEVGRLGQRVDPLHGGDVDPLTGGLLSVAEIRDILVGRDLPVVGPAGMPIAVGGGSVQRFRERRRAATRSEVPAAPTAPVEPTSLTAAVVAEVDGSPAPGVWVMGVSGGCGESTVAAILPDAVAGQRRWPPAGPATAVPVLMVARGSMASLTAAQRYAGEWASSAAQRPQLLGLLVVADAPGSEPRPVTDLIRLLSGGLPQVWRLPWVRDWRLMAPQDGLLPRSAAAVTRVITDLYRCPNRPI